MDFKTMLEEEFFELNKEINENKIVTLTSGSLDISAFKNKLNDYRNSIEEKYKKYNLEKEASIEKYESRLKAEDIFKRNDAIYNNSLEKMNNGQFFDAMNGFLSIKGHRDSDVLSEKCRSALEQKYNDAKAKFNSQSFDEAEALFDEIKQYKDSADMAAKCSKEADIFKRNDAIYQSALSLFKNNEYLEAKKSFDSILDFKDSKGLSIECEKHLDVDYEKALGLFNSKQFEDALSCFRALNPYKDSSYFANQCELEIEKKAKNKEEERIRLETEKKKKKKKLITIISSSVTGLIVLALIFIFVVIVPGMNGKSQLDSAIQLINSGEYDAAISKLANLNYGDSKNQLNVARAGLAFKEEKINEGIKYMCDAGGTTDVNYDSKGGNISRPSITVKTVSDFTNDCSKDYYDFEKWNISSFAIRTAVNEYSCDLSLFASYNAKTYNITYVLNGGTNSASNPTSYTYESPEITLKDPNKTGYTFTGWTHDGSIQRTIPTHTFGDLTFKADWNANIYHVILDVNGGALSGSASYDVTFDSLCSFPVPTREYYNFLGWYYNDTKIENTWTIASNCTVVAKWECISLQYLNYGTYNNGKEVYISGLKGVYPYSELVVPDSINGLSVTSISDQAFYNVSGIASVKLPDTITQIGKYAFAKMPDLISVELSKRLTSVDDYAFYQCDSLESVELPSSITSVGTHVLTGCTSLQKIKTELTSNYHLGDFFSNYGDLSYLNVPASLTTVEVASGTVVPKKFFYGLETLTDITFKEEITEIEESAFAYCKILVCPSSVRKIGANAFEGLGKIDDTVSLPEGLEQIGDMAFWGTYFKTINLPNTLNNIGISVFGATHGNSQLKTINFNGTKAKWISFAGEKPSSYSWASDLNYGYKIYCTDAYYTSSIYNSECVWTNY